MEPAAGHVRKAPTPQEQLYQQPAYRQPVRQRVPGPCFNCLEIGHLKATCPKLNRQYPFEQKAGEPSSYVCDAQLEGENESVVKVDRLPEEQLVLRLVDEYKYLNKEAKVTETVDGGLTDKEVNTSTIVNGEQPLMGTECSELDPELSRCWEIEQDSTQINDVQSHLFSCLSFWEEVLVTPPKF